MMELKNKIIVLKYTMGGRGVRWQTRKSRRLNELNDKAVVLTQSAAKRKMKMRELKGLVGQYQKSPIFAL